MVVRYAAEWVPTSCRVGMIVHCVCPDQCWWKCFTRLNSGIGTPQYDMQLQVGTTSLRTFVFRCLSIRYPRDRLSRLRNSLADHRLLVKATMLAISTRMRKGESEDLVAERARLRVGDYCLSQPSTDCIQFTCMQLTSPVARSLDHRNAPASCRSTATALLARPQPAAAPRRVRLTAPKTPAPGSPAAQSARSHTLLSPSNPISRIHANQSTDPPASSLSLSALSGPRSCRPEISGPSQSRLPSASAHRPSINPKPKPASAIARPAPVLPSGSELI